MSIEAAKGAIMDPHMSGRFTSEFTIFSSRRTELLCRGCFTLLWILSSNFAMIISCSALGGSHGVPQAHYKGRQGDYYIMVCAREIFNRWTEARGCL